MDMCYPSTADVAAQIAAAQRRWGVERVFLATDSPRRDLFEDVLRAHGIDGAADFGRFGHSCVPFKRSKLVVFGGEKQFNVQRKTRDCLNDVRIFDTKAKTW